MGCGDADPDAARPLRDPVEPPLEPLDDRRTARGRKCRYRCGRSETRSRCRQQRQRQGNKKAARTCRAALSLRLSDPDQCLTPAQMFR
jgi:hypothetical protein